MSDLKGKIWMDGDLLEWSDAKIHVLTHTLHYGTGVFEGVRAYETSAGPAIFRLNDHTKRLFNSADLIGMSIPYSPEELNDAQANIVRENKLNNAYKTYVLLWLRRHGFKSRQFKSSCMHRCMGLGLLSWR